MADPVVSVKIKGIPQLQRGTHQLFGRIETESERQFQSVADQVAMMVRSRVPHQSGALAASLSGDSAAHGASVGYDLIYAGPVDYGGWPPGRPYVSEGRYLYPTAKEAVGLLKRAGESAARSQIRTMSWPKPL